MKRALIVVTSHGDVGKTEKKPVWQAAELAVERWRNLVVLDPKARKGFNPETVDRKKVKNHRRAKLLKRIFKIDVGTCPKCGIDMEIRSAVHEFSPSLRCNRKQCMY